MFSNPIQPREPDYFDHVADGFSIVSNGFGAVLFYIVAAILIGFGWPFALLSWFCRK